MDLDGVFFKYPYRSGRKLNYQRSGCPINLTMELLGDQWSLVIIRDMMFGNKRHFRDLLTHSMEGIASNILASRLKRLTEAGLITRADDPSHKQKGIYSLSEMAIELVPVLAQIGAWGSKHLPATPELSARARLLEAGGPTLWHEFMQELRALHLGARAHTSANGGGTSVLVRLDEAHRAAAARAAKTARRRAL